MRRIPVFKKMKGIIKIDTYEGELIEDKVRRLTENKEPIKDSAPLVYTKKADGVLPQYNIRTDKWDLVQGKMEVANKQKILKAKGCSRCLHEVVGSCLKNCKLFSDVISTN